LSNDITDWREEFFSLNPDAVETVEVEEKKKYTLDLFKTVLPAIDRKDKSFYGKLSAEEKKGISPWLLMRWMTSSASDREQTDYLLNVNDFVNVNFSALSPKKTLGIAGHEELQWMLLTLCGTGRSPMRKFLKAPKGMIKNKLEEVILGFFPSLRDDELELFFKMNSKSDLELFFKENSYDDKTIKELLKDYAKGK
jgi:hypothetical protein